MAAAGSRTAAAPQQAPQPQQLERQQQAAAPQDCMQCRVIGTGVCLAASAYLAAGNYAAPVGTGRAHRAVMLFAAGGFLALGIARAML